MIQLEFRAARLAVKLGCGAEERARPQAVDLDVAVRLAALPAACTTDDLRDTVCYAELIEAARKYVLLREFNLVERLAHDLHGELLPLLPPGAELWLRVTKLCPPVAELAGGVSFALGPFEGLSR
jgi:dihydroneopterin aldolase